MNLRVNNRFSDRKSIKNSRDPSLYRMDVGGLLNACASGSTEAFDLLYERTSRYSFGLMMVMLRDREDAAEALQEVYVRVWTKAHLYQRTGAQPLNWIKSIARNVAIDRLRERTRAGIHEEFDDTHACTRGLGIEDSLTLSECLAELSAPNRLLIKNVYLEGLSYDELAHQNAVPLNTMKSLIRRSLIKLKECMQRSETKCEMTTIC